MSTEEIKQAIEEDQRERTQACIKEISEVLAKYRCSFSANLVIGMTSGTHFNIDVIPSELLKG